MYRAPNKAYPAYIFDLDGTVTLGDALLPGAGETITHLRALGARIVFLSNNPTHTRNDYAQRLTRLGLPTPTEDILHSTAALIDFLQGEMPGAVLIVLGEPVLEGELAAAGFQLTMDPGRADAVIASFDRTFTYAKLQAAFDAIRAGARLFATNADRFCPVPGGGQPDAAAIIAAVEASTGNQVEAVLGKPSRFMADSILRLVNTSPENCLITGDRLETDVLMGLESGMDAALVLTGATAPDELLDADVQPTYVLKDLRDLLPKST